MFISDTYFFLQNLSRLKVIFPSHFDKIIIIFSNFLLLTKLEYKLTRRIMFIGKEAFRFKKISDGKGKREACGIVKGR